MDNFHAKAIEILETYIKSLEIKVEENMRNIENLEISIKVLKANEVMRDSVNNQ